VSEQKVSMFKDLLFISFEHGVMDCWILAREVFNRYGIRVPEYDPARQAVAKTAYKLEIVGQEMEKGLVSWIEIDEPEIPCLIVMSLGNSYFIHHVGVYINEGEFIHITKQIGSVVIERLDNPLYANRRFYKYVTPCSS